MKKLTVQQRGELTSAQKKTWDKQVDRPRTDPKKDYGNKRYAPRAAPAASGTGTCPNHPESDHTAAQCHVADTNRKCARFLAEGKCTYSRECKFLHDEAARTPEVVTKAKQRLEQSRQGSKTLSMPVAAQPQKPDDRAYDAPARCFPMRAGSQLTDEEMALADKHMWLGGVKYAQRLSDQNWRYSALKYVGFNPDDQFTFS